MSEKEDFSCSFKVVTKKYFEKRHAFIPPHDEIFGFSEKERENEINWGKKEKAIDYFDPEDFDDY